MVESDGVEYYGLCIPPELLEDREEPITKVFTDKTELFKAMKEFKGSRFKRFSTEMDAVEFTLSSHPLKVPEVISTPVAGDSCAFKSLKPQEMVKFRKSIESGNIDQIRELIRENPRYLMTPSDTPAILQEGSRYNALHVAAKHGRTEAGSLILDAIKGELTRQMYPEEDIDQNLRRRERLLDLYLNMPDKGGGDTPLHLATKFGHVGMVELLVMQTRTDTTPANKFGEIPADIVCSRAKEVDKEKEEKIRGLLCGLQSIPIYKEFGENGPSVLGEPVPASELVRTPLHCSPNHSASPQWTPVYSSPRTSNGMSPLTGSPLLLKSPLLMKQSPLAESPGTIYSPVAVSPVFLSAILGPLSSDDATSLYKELKNSPSRERLKDPVRGLERQCREAAKRNGTDWTEFWNFLGDYEDLTSELGLQKLENHISQRYIEHARREEEERCREVDDYDNDVFIDELGELEFVTKSSRPQQNLDAETSLNGVQNANESSSHPTEPLSPMALLTSTMTSLNFDNSEKRDIPDNRVANFTETRARGPSEEAKELVNQFSFMFAHTLIDCQPQSDTDTEIQDWGIRLLNHWETFRRHVNNMRSDPEGRWAGLDYSVLTKKIVRDISDEMELDVDWEELQRLHSLLERLASFQISSIKNSENEEGKSEIRGFRRQESSSNKNVERLREIQPLARILVYFMKHRKFEEKENYTSVWDINSQDRRVSTKGVNKARKFLHAKVFSSSESSTERRGSSADDFSWVNQGLDNGELQLGRSPLAHDVGDRLDYRRSRLKSESEGSEASSRYSTPPSSPAPSSMVTADEGEFLWLEGTMPTQTDRQVFEALRCLTGEDLSKFPLLQTYLWVAGNFSEKERKRWPRKLPEQRSYSHLQPKKLDLSLSVV